MTGWSNQYKNLTVEKKGNICDLTFNRPEKRNAISEDLMLEVLDAIENINAEEEIRAVVIKGAGHDFCAGFDFQYFGSDVSTEDVRRVVDIGPKLKNAILNARPITIASIGGNCVGGGVVIAFACDFRFATQNSKFWLPETKLGIPVAFGAIPMLSDGLPRSLAMDFVLLGRTLTAQELLDVQLLNGIASSAEDRDEHVARICAEIADIPKMAAELTKKQILAARDSWTRTPYEFADASLLQVSLTDPESIEKREQLVSALRGNR